MGAAVHHNLDIHRDYDLSRHAWERMSGRGLSPDAIRCVINFGRVAYIRGATIYAVGRKEIERFGRDGIDLSDVEGVQVVCSDSRVIITAYRNHDFRGLRSQRNRRRYRRAA